MSYHFVHRDRVVRLSVFPKIIPILAVLEIMAISHAMAAGNACHYEHEAMLPSMTTIAGSGVPGRADGSALSDATFTEPTGVAVDRDGSVLVADAGADNIRRIRDGVVTTLAGVSQAGPTREQRIGGYVDGPVGVAKFDRPTGIAVDKNGDVYIADSQNHAIRKLHDGIVTTLTKALDAPRALVFDNDNVLFVADEGSGVRQVSLTDGTLSPVDSISVREGRDICGISVSGGGKSRILAYTDSTAIHVISGTIKRDVRFDDVVEPVFEKHTLGNACSLQILDLDSLLVSNPVSNGVNFVRLPLDSIVAEPPVIRPVSSGSSFGGEQFGGFADGTSDRALTDLPGGFAKMRDGSVVFADAGNRRVRRIRDIDTRHVVSPGIDGSLDMPSPPANDYRIAFVGNSFAFTNAMWPDSIPGQIERGVIDQRSATGLLECPAVTAYRLSDASIGDTSDFVSTYLSDGQADLVLFLVDAYNLKKDIGALKPQDASDDGVFTVANYATGWRQVIPDRLKHLQAQLEQSGTKFAVVIVPDGRSISPLENTLGGRIRMALRNYYTDARAGMWTYKVANEFEGIFDGREMHTIKLLKPLIADEERGVRTPLFYEQDSHPTIAGNEAIGRAIASDLNRWKPWSKASKGF